MGLHALYIFHFSFYTCEVCQSPNQQKRLSAKTYDIEEEILRPQKLSKGSSKTLKKRCSQTTPKRLRHSLLLDTRHLIKLRKLAFSKRILPRVRNLLSQSWCQRNRRRSRAVSPSIAPVFTAQSVFHIFS